jgi:hypothetical protein
VLGVLLLIALPDTGLAAPLVLGMLRECWAGELVQV